MGGKPPNPPKSVLMSNTHSTHSKSAESWHTTHPQLHGSQSQGALGGSPPIDCPPWVACGQPHSRVSEWRLANIHQEQLKSHSGILPRVTAPSRSVGRLSAGHHRLILPLCELRLNAPLQHRSHRPNVTTTARTKSIYCNVNRLELFIRLLPLLKSPSR